GGVVLLAAGLPMTFDRSAEATTVEAGAMGDDKGAARPQVIARGPVAAVLPIKHFGTNGGGFFGANSAHPFENPTSWTNVFECVSILIFPFSLVVMFGRMLGQMRHAAVIYGVMLLMFAGMIAWAVHTDTQKPNPALLAQPERTRSRDGVDAPGRAALPVDQSGLGNLEGKELRFGPSAGPTFAAVPTAGPLRPGNCLHPTPHPPP